MKNIELIKYRLKYNDVELKNRIKLILYSTLLVLILPTFILLKPFSNLKNLLIYQSQIYQTENSIENAVFCIVYVTIWQDAECYTRGELL